MKRLLLLLIPALLFLGKTTETRAQAHLKIVGMIGFPDSAYTNLAYPLTAVVQNIGNTPYQGTIQIIMMSDSGIASFIYQSSSARLLLPGDTAGLTPPNGFYFPNTAYRQGGNVVVVWPYAGTSALIDTITTSVYIYGLYTGIKEIDGIEKLKAYPNPTARGLTLESPVDELEDVRIFGLDGRELATYQFTGFGNREIPMQSLAPGIYLLEIISRAGHHSAIRVLKTE
jgi:hypothetical protein